MVGIAGMLTTGAVVASASAASAHTPSISATCDGVTASGSGYERTDTNTLTVTVDGQTKTQTFKDEKTLTVKVPQDGEIYTWSASVTTTNSNPEYSKSESGTVGPCGDTPDSKKISYCHWTEGGHYNYLTTDKWAFYNNGHISHKNDIYPAGSVVHGGTPYSWAAQGDQSLLDTNCGEAAPTKEASASASTTAGTCLAKGDVTFAIDHATWDDPADVTDGSRTATAESGYLFANGQSTMTVNYTIPPQTDWKDAACQPTFEVTQVCGNITITFHNNSKWDRWPDYRIEGDGVQPKDYGTGPTYTTVKVPAGQSVKILDHDFAEDYNGGSADVTYQDILGAERDIDTAAVTVTVDTDCQPPVTNTICEIPAAGDTSTNLHPLWTDVDTRSAGHSEYVSGGLRLWTDDASSNAKVAQERAADFDLKNTGLVGLDFDLTSGTIKPGVQLYVNFDGTNEGTLVFEEAYGQDLWLTTGSSQVVKDGAPVIGGGNGSQWHGTIDQWLTKFPTAKVTGIGFSLGSGVHADGVLHSITVGCTQYFFDRETAPQTPPVVVPPVTPGVPPVVVPPVTPTPPEVGGVKVTAPPEVEGVKHTSPAVTPTVEGVKHGAAAALPRTGTDAGQYGAAGLLLLMAGLGLVLVTRRHGRGRAH